MQHAHRGQLAGRRRDGRGSPSLVDESLEVGRRRPSSIVAPVRVEPRHVSGEVAPVGGERVRRSSALGRQPRQELLDDERQLGAHRVRSRRSRRAAGRRGGCRPPTWRRRSRPGRPSRPPRRAARSNTPHVPLLRALQVVLRPACTRWRARSSSPSRSSRATGKISVSGSIAPRIEPGLLDQLAAGRLLHRLAGHVPHAGRDLDHLAVVRRAGTGRRARREVLPLARRRRGRRRRRLPANGRCRDRRTHRRATRSGRRRDSRSARRGRAVSP